MFGSMLGDAAGKVAGSIVGEIGSTVDALFTSDEERITAETARERLRLVLPSLQAKAQIAAAQHRSVFVAGARPFILWVCGAGLAYHFIVRDLLAWTLRIAAPEVEPPPVLVGVGELTALLGGVLGLGGFRTVEKMKGKA